MYVVWGSTYLAIRVVVDTIPPMLSGGVRYLVAAAIFVAVLRVVRGPGTLTITRREAVGVTVIGALLLLGGNGLVAVAEQEVPSGLAALVIGSVPLWVVLMRSAHGDRVPPATLVGVLVGFVGLAVLVLPGDRPGNAPLWGLLVLIAAALSWASGSFYSARATLPADALTAATWQMLMGGALMMAVGTVAGEWGRVHPAEVSLDSWLALAYLIVFGSCLAFTAYSWLLRNAPISTVATYAFVNPVIALLLGWSILEEEITATMLLGAAAIILSVAAVVRREGGEAPREPGPAAPAGQGVAGGAGGASPPTGATQATTRRP